MRGHATNATDVTSDHPLMRTSQDRAMGSERYHTRADVERGLDRA